MRTKRSIYSTFLVFVALLLVLSTAVITAMQCYHDYERFVHNTQGQSGPQFVRPDRRKRHLEPLAETHLGLLRLLVPQCFDWISQCRFN